MTTPYFRPSLCAVLLIAAISLAGCGADSPTPSDSSSTAKPSATESSPAVSIAEQVSQALLALPEIDALQISSVSTATETVAGATDWVQLCTWIEAAPVSTDLTVSRTDTEAAEFSQNTECDPAATILHGVLRDDTVIAPARSESDGGAPIAGKWEQTEVSEEMMAEAFEMITGLSALKDAIDHAGEPTTTTENSASYDIARDDFEGLIETEMHGALSFDRTLTDPFSLTITMNEKAQIESYEIEVDTSNGDNPGNYRIERTFTYDASSIKEPENIGQWMQDPVADAFDVLFRMILVS